MVVDGNSICIDTDFLLKFIEINAFDETEKIRILKSIFMILEKRPIMHPLVYENELGDFIKPNQKKYIFDDEVVLIPSMDDIHGNEPAKKMYYEMMVKELYRAINGEDIDQQDIWSFWIRQKSLGEIHSLAMCSTCTCEMFLSDDNDSKYLCRIVNERFSVAATINVYNREEICSLLKEKDYTDLLTNKEIKIIKYKGYSH